MGTDSEVGFAGIVCDDAVAKVGAGFVSDSVALRIGDEGGVSVGADDGPLVTLGAPCGVDTSGAELVTGGTVGNVNEREVSAGRDEGMDVRVGSIDVGTSPGELVGAGEFVSLEVSNGGGIGTTVGNVSSEEVCVGDSVCESSELDVVSSGGPWR